MHTRSGLAGKKQSHEEATCSSPSPSPSEALTAERDAAAPRGNLQSSAGRSRSAPQRSHLKWQAWHEGSDVTRPGGIPTLSQFGLPPPGAGRRAGADRQAGAAKNKQTPLHNNTKQAGGAQARLGWKGDDLLSWCNGKEATRKALARVGGGIEEPGLGRSGVALRREEGCEEACACNSPAV